MDTFVVSAYYIMSVSVFQLLHIIPIALAVFALALQRKCAMLISLLYYTFSLQATAMFITTSVCMEQDLLASKPVVYSLKVCIVWILFCTVDCLVYLYSLYRLLKSDNAYLPANSQHTHLFCCIMQGVTSYHLLSCTQCDVRVTLQQLCLYLTGSYLLSILMTYAVLKIITSDNKDGIPHEKTALNTYKFKEYV